MPTPPLMANEGESKPRQLPPAGAHVARSISIVDHGTQKKSYVASEEKLVHQIRITWELPDEKAVFDEARGEEPFIISKDYTLSLYEKASLRKDLESWRGKAFTAQELLGFNVFELVGIPCMLSVIHKQSADGKRTYANIASISRVPKGLKCPEQIKDTIVYNIAEGRGGAFDQLPQWIQKQIEGSQEFQSEGGGGVGESQPQPGDPDFEDDNSEIPF